MFAERGYDGASIDEIARRAGVSAPVVYDHFASKQDLYERLLERTRDELLEVWREHLFTDEPADGPDPARDRRVGGDTSRPIATRRGCTSATPPASRPCSEFHRAIHRRAARRSA